MEEMFAKKSSSTSLLSRDA